MLEKQPDLPAAFARRNRPGLFFLAVCLTIFFPKTLPAQSIWKGWQLETTLNTGQITRHTPKLTIDNSQRVNGFELNFNHQTWGRRDWNTWKRFPQMGLAFIHFDLGDGAHGTSTGLLPNLSAPIFTVYNTTLFFRYGSGLVRVSNPFDFQDNPGQNAIGSHWNNVTQFRLGGIWRATGHFSVGGGGSFTHFSNGGAHRPNFGLNIPALFLTAAWSPVSLKKADFVHSSLPKKEAGRQRFGGLVEAGLAWGEIQVEDGPTYPIWTASMALARSFNKVNRAFIGVDWEFHAAIQYFLAHAGNHQNEADLRPQATRWMLFLADETRFGNLGVHLQTGIYTSRKSELVPWFLYNKLAFRYYLPGFFGSQLRPWAGVYLKSHKITAEYISLNAGLSF